MNNQQPKKKKFNWWWLVIGLIAIFLLVNLTTPSTNVKSISLTQLRQDADVKYDETIGEYIIDPDTNLNKIYGAYKVDSTYYIIYNETMSANSRLNAKQQASIQSNPANIKTYADVVVYDTTGTAMRILLTNPTIVVDSGEAPGNWLDWERNFLKNF